MDNIIVQLQKINKYYGDTIKNQVLFDIDLDIAEGKIIALIGPSGSGKSTLLNILGTLDKPSYGNIIIKNQDMGELNEDQLADFRNKFLGFIFQFHYLLPEFNALENVLMPYQIAHRGMPSKEIQEKATVLLEKVGLGDKIYSRINNLSGGQQQRVAIARALINQPKLILADEPTGNLDTKSSEQTLELLRNINLEFGSTFIIVTHDRNVASKTDRIIELVDGRIYRDLLPNELGQAKTWDELFTYSCTEC